MLDEAIRQVEGELAAAADEHTLAQTLETIASARYFGLLDEYLTLVRARKLSLERGRTVVAAAEPAKRPSAKAVYFQSATETAK